jgi:hypothetical protein
LILSLQLGSAGAACNHWQSPGGAAWRAIVRKMKFLLKHALCKHYCEIFFPDQIEYIFAAKKCDGDGLHSRLGQDSVVLCLDPALIKIVGLLMANSSWQMQ